MRVDVAYVNGLEERLELGGDDRELHYFENELRDWSWEYDVDDGGGVSFRRKPSKPRKVRFPVGVSSSAGADGIALRNLVERVGEMDVLSRTPGRLYVGGWYIRCWIVGCEPSDYWMDDRLAELDLTLLVPDPGWIQEQTSRYVPETGSGDPQPSGSPDFPFDFPFEFKRERQSKQVYVGGLEPQDMRLVVAGPAQSPAVEIGGNLYKVNAYIPAGSSLEVDTMAKTVRIVAPDGTWTDAFRYREPGASGSGSYIFERVPVGSSALDWDNGFSFDLTLYEVRTACPWEEA